MFKYYNMGKFDGKNLILDIVDKSVEAVSDECLNAIASKGVAIGDGSKLDFSLRQDDRRYYIYIGNELSVHVSEGRFPDHSNRCDLHSHEIRLSKVWNVNGYFFLRVTCLCFGNYAMEFPLHMEHIIVIPYRNALNGEFFMNFNEYMATWFRYPIYLAKSPDEKIKMQKRTNGNCPDDVIVLKSTFPDIDITKDRLRLYGKEYNRIPTAVEIGETLNYL